MNIRELDNQLKARMLKPHPKPNPEYKWQTRAILFAIAGVLGNWGTFVIWNCGREPADGRQFILGYVEPIWGWIACLACILSIFLLREALDFGQEE